MSLVHTIDGVDVTGRLEFGTFTNLVTSARGGERGSGKVIVTDPSGELDLKGWHTYTCDETLCVGRERLFTGRIGGKEISRGPEGPIGVGRVWECTLEDVNVFAHMLTFKGDDAKRPAETTIARTTWLLGTSAVDGSFVDTGFVNSDFPLNFDEADYRDEYPETPLDEISGVVGRDWFLFWDYDAEAVGLFYDTRDQPLLESPLKISNVEGDADDPLDPDAVVFNTGSSTGSDDAVVNRDHADVYDRGAYKYKTGTVYATRPATTAVFFHDAPHGRSVVIESSRIGSPITAINLLNAYLEAHSVERDTVTVPVRLPARKVNYAVAGDRIRVKLEHEPGYEDDYVWLRTASRTLSEAGLGDDNEPWYDVVLECTDKAPLAAGGPGGGSSGPPTDVFPHQPPGDPVHYFESRVQFTTDGYGSSGGVGGVAPGPNHTTAVDGDVVLAVVAGVIYNFHADITLDPADLMTGHDWGFAEDDGTGAWGPLHTSVAGPGTTVTFDGSFTAIVDQTLWLTAGAGAASHIPKAASIYAYVDPVGWDTGEVVGPPAPGQWTDWETVTMTGDSGTTASPFADASLQVKVDNTDQTAAVIDYDGATGDFQLGFTPTPTEVVQVRYQGR